MKAIEKAVNTGSMTAGEKFGTFIANKIIPPSSSSKNNKNLNENILNELNQLN